MTPHDVLTALFARVGAANGAALLITDDETREWPEEALSALKAQKILANARPANTVVCPGCEQECVMRVHTLRRASGPATSFVVCDKRSDINRVTIPEGRVKQWRCDPEAVCRFVTTSLGLRRSASPPPEPSLLPIGMALGSKRHQMLCLRVAYDLPLVVARGERPLADVVEFRGGEYRVDGLEVRRLVDAATTADPRHTPSDARRAARKLDTEAMRDRWQKAFRKLKRERPGMSRVWYSRQIAKTPEANRRSAETIRKHLRG